MQKKKKKKNPQKKKKKNNQTKTEQSFLKTRSSEPWQYCELNKEGIFANSILIICYFGNTGHLMFKENLSDIHFSIGWWHVSLNLVMM